MAAGSYPGEDRHLSRAVEQHVAAAAAQLAGEQPAWLARLIGPRPADPIGELTWDAVVADIARWRSHQRISGAGLGPAPTAGERCIELGKPSANDALPPAAGSCAPTGTNRPGPHHAAIDELLARRQVLDGILDTAPPDTRASSTPSAAASSASPTSTRSCATPSRRAPSASTGSSNTGPTSSSTPRSPTHSAAKRGDPTHNNSSPPRARHHRRRTRRRHQPQRLLVGRRPPRAQRHRRHRPRRHPDCMARSRRRPPGHAPHRDPRPARPDPRQPCGDVDEFDQFLRQLRDTREGLVAIERYDLGIDL